MSLRLRTSEWLLITYFGYLALIAPIFRDRPHLAAQPFYELILVSVLLLALARIEEQTAWQKAVSFVRDWLPLLLTLVAFQEMELFLPRAYPRFYEGGWVRQDQVLLTQWRLTAAIESLGKVVPFYLELCYLLVYGLGAVCIGLFYGRGKRTSIDNFLIIYLAGTLLAYALFPYFPSQPPRIAFPAINPPHITTWVRELNLLILRKGTIHLGVFPSAHVSCAFSAAWALFVTMPDRKIYGWLFALYACSVSVATVYGRYHYVADVIAGIAVSLLAIFGYLLARRLSCSTS